MKILVLNSAEVVRLLPMSECMNVMREALSALSRGKVEQPLRTVFKPNEAKGVMGSMPSYLSDPPQFGLKTVCVFKGNPSLGKDAHQGAVQLFSGETGELMAVMNASAITAIRTAAVSGVATDLLARADAGNLAIIGAGVQARSHLSAMAEARAIKRCRIVSRHFQNAQRFVEEIKEHFEFPVEPVETVAEALQSADLIVTVTNSVEPVVKREWISAGAHLNAVGSSIPKSREVDSETIAVASLFVDRRESTLNESGDYLFAANDGLIGPDHIRAEIGEVLIGESPGRTSNDEITMFKSLGLAVEDLFAANHVYRKAKQLNAGTWVEF